MKKALFIIFVVSLLLFVACKTKVTPPPTDTVSEGEISVEIAEPALEEESLTTEIEATEEPDLGNAV